MIDFLIGLSALLFILTFGVGPLVAFVISLSRVLTDYHPKIQRLCDVITALLVGGGFIWLCYGLGHSILAAGK